MAFADPPDHGAHRGTVVARNGAVAASQPLAVAAGLRVLATGGTFADAAIATSAVLCVVEPSASHLGGDAFLIVHDASRRENLALNGSGAAPRTASPADFPDGIPLRGPRAATVPGLVSTWFALHDRFGSRPIAELLAPAIAYAEDGFPAGPRYARVFGASATLFAAHPGLADLGAEPGVRVGQIVRQPDLARTLRAIAEHGRDGFYVGPVAEKIAADGHFTRDDLAAHRTRVLAPIGVRYKNGLVVHGQPPPSQGHILLEELAIARGFDLADGSEAARIHRLVEAKKLAFADRVAHLGDPEAREIPIDALLSDAHADRQRARIDPNRARPDYPAGDLAALGSDTTYFLVADGSGSAVSFIQSVFHVFGSAHVVPGTGVLLNNRLTGFSLDPRSPNCLAPGRRPAHTLNAWLATHEVDGRLALVGGSPGGHVQVQTNLQLIVNLVDGQLDPQAAVEAPRWQHLPPGAGTVTSADDALAGPGTLEIEDRVSEKTRSELAALGHDVQPIGPWAHGSAAQVLQVLPDGAFALGSDPRCDGQAAGL